MSNTSGKKPWAFQMDPYQKELETTVLSIEEKGLVFEDTNFYPTGGGQPGDCGVLRSSGGRELIISNTRRCRETGLILHEVAEADHGLKPGEAVTLKLDWQRRYAHMRMHTCLHLLSAVIPHGVTGGGMTDKKGRLDFNIQGHLPDKSLLTEQLNALIQRGMPVVAETLSESILDEQPELVKTMSVQPPRGVGSIRMIRIADVDFQPCGGTHVMNTSEIGPVLVSKVESKGKQNKRVQIVFA